MFEKITKLFHKNEDQVILINLDGTVPTFEKESLFIRILKKFNNDSVIEDIYARLLSGESIADIEKKYFPNTILN